MLVYVIRHGQSVANEKGLWTGWLDSPLTENGKKDAEGVGEFLSGINFDKVYSSDLARANETARIALPGKHIEKSELLRETFIGSIEGKPINTLTEEQIVQAGKIGYAAYGGESREDLYVRIREFMKKLEDDGGDNLAVFTHSGWTRGMLTAVTGVQIPDKNVRFDNCAIAIFEYENNHWRLHSWINMR